jgi:hypothetical protein
MTASLQKDRAFEIQAKNLSLLYFYFNETGYVLNYISPGRVSRGPNSSGQTSPPPPDLLGQQDGRLPAAIWD